MFAVVTTFLFSWKEPKVWAVVPRLDLREAVILSIYVPEPSFARPPPVVSR